jgi:hypothetical protein
MIWVTYTAAAKSTHINLAAMFWAFIAALRAIDDIHIIPSLLS